MENVLLHLPILRHTAPHNNERFIENPEDCLELLLALRPLTKQAANDPVSKSTKKQKPSTPERPQVVLEWPEGEVFSVTSERSFKHLSLSISEAREWFSASGTLQIDESSVLDLQELIEQLRHRKSRFLPLGEKRFLALTESFHRRLESLAMVSTQRKKKLLFHPPYLSLVHYLH